MTTPLVSHHKTPTLGLRDPGNPPGREWRCRCGKLLGVIDGDQLHIRFAHGHEYLVGLPATCTCRGCGGLSGVQHPTASVRLG